MRRGTRYVVTLLFAFVLDSAREKVLFLRYFSPREVEYWLNKWIRVRLSLFVWIHVFSSLLLLSRIRE